MNKSGDGVFGLPIEFPNPKFATPYSRLASWKSHMERGELLFHLGPEQPPKVVAQLGGLAYEWVDPPKPEHAGSTVVVRTFANSEPWVEVLMNNSGDILVTPHIT